MMLNPIVWIVLLSDLIVGSLLIALAFPLIQRKVKPNYWYGFRIPKAFKSEDNWYRINEYGGRLQFRAGVGIMLVSPLILLVGDPPFDVWRVVGLTVVPPVALLAWMIIGTFRFASRLD